MGNSKRLWQALAGVDVLVGCFVLSGCDWRESGAGEGSEPVELRVYRVPVERQDELFGMLRQALGVESANEIGRAAKGLNGSLLVTAPARIHEGLEEVLSADLGAAPVVRPVTLTYWFLVGRPFNPAEGNPPFAVAGQQVPVLEPVLGQIADAQGPTEFALLEQLQLSSLDNEYAVAQGRLGRHVLTSRLSIARNAVANAGRVDTPGASVSVRKSAVG